MSAASKHSRTPSIFRSKVVIRPRNKPTLTLAEAITWIAFTASVRADTLLLAFNLADPRLVYPARARLICAVDRLVDQAIWGTIRLTGLYTSGGETPNWTPLVPDIPPHVLKIFSRFDAFIDGFRPERGLAWRHSGELLDTSFIDPPGPAFQHVEVDQRQLLALFPNGHHRLPPQLAGSRKPRGRPKGSGSLEKADQPFVDKMSELLASNTAKSPNDAARLVALGSPGHGSLESKQRRLFRNFIKQQTRK